MIPVISLLLILVLSLLVTRVAAISLTYTGMSRQTARFQARSAFSGVGFTTKEAEQVVRHPVRRRIILLLMLLGNAGIITAVSSLILTFVSQEESTTLLPKIVLLVAGVLALWGLASSQWLDRRMSHLVGWALRRFTTLDVKDYASVLHLAGEYQVSELAVRKDDWMAGKSLGELALSEEGILVLGIERADGTYLGTPRGPSRLVGGDTLILYGRAGELERLDRRRRGRGGDRDHLDAVRDQQEAIQAEKERDPTRPKG